MSEFIGGLVSGLLNIIDQLSYIGIFLGMTLQSSFIPFPSEVVLIPAGALVANGKMNFLTTLFASIMGSLFGSFINYFLALFLGRRIADKLISRYGKIFFLSKESLEASNNYFKKHGEITTFIARLIPGIRQIISLSAGFSKMNLLKFTIFTLAGAGIWSIFLITVGYFAGQNSNWLEQNSLIITLLTLIIILLTIIFYIKFKQRKSI